MKMALLLVLHQAGSYDITHLLKNPLTRLSTMPGKSQEASHCPAFSILSHATGLRVLSHGMWCLPRGTWIVISDKQFSLALKLGPSVLSSLSSLLENSKAPQTSPNTLIVLSLPILFRCNFMCMKTCTCACVSCMPGARKARWPRMPWN